MELKVIRAKEGMRVPSNPEMNNSVLTLVQKGMVALVPSSFSLDESKYDLIQKVNLDKKKK